jgi:RHS repeat-associated protein
MTNAWTGGSQSYDTGANFDAMNRRQKVTWADGSWWDYGYDGRGEVTSGSRKWSGGGTVAGQQYGYTFDNIGNRLTATVNGRTSTYTPNSLNQYTQRTVPGAYDILGTAAASATITVGGVSLGANDRNGTYFYKEVSVANTSSPVSQTSSVVATLSGSSSTRNITKYVPKTPESFGYDLDGNLQSDGSWVYTWDGENRLIGMDNSSIAGIPTAAKRKLAFTYDTQGRRIRAQVWYPNPNNSGTLLLHHTIRYLYDGWNLVAEIGDTGRRIRTYAWGQDVSGSLSRAGGIGGLLFETQSYSGKVSGMGYDLNGNVTALVDMANGAAVAQYEYGPFGEAIRQSGDYAELNPIRFSSKYQDNETGLLYYGYRFYNPGIGRWLSRDPSGERDLPNLYGYIKNSPIMNLDPLGLQHYDYNPGRLKPRKPAGTVRNISGVPAYTMHLYLFQEFWQRAQYPYMLTVSSEDTYVFGGSFLDQVKDQDSVLDHYDEMKNRVANDARDMLDEGRATDPETSFEDGDSDTITANDINVVLALGEFTLIWDAQCDIHCGETVKYNCKIKWSVRDLYDFPWWNVPYSLIGGVPFHDAGDWTDEENGTVK